MSTILVIRAEVDPGWRLALYRCPVKSCRRGRWCLTSTLEQPVTRSRKLWEGDTPRCRNRSHRKMPAMIEETAQVLGDDLEWTPAQAQRGDVGEGG